MIMTNLVIKAVKASCVKDIEPFSKPLQKVAPYLLADMWVNKFYTHDGALLGFSIEESPNQCDAAVYVDYYQSNGDHIDVIVE